MSVFLSFFTEYKNTKRYLTFPLKKSKKGGVSLHKPTFVEYFDISHEMIIQVYLVNETPQKCYFVSTMTHDIAKKIGRVDELYTVSTNSIPKNWVSYKILKEKEFQENMIPRIFKENMEEILDVIARNYHHISRICSFLEEFTDYSCGRDFMRPCIVSWAITEKYLPEEIIEKLFMIVFRTYPNFYKKYELKLLLDTRIGHIISNVK